MPGSTTVPKKPVIREPGVSTSGSKADPSISGKKGKEKISANGQAWQDKNGNVTFNSETQSGKEELDTRSAQRVSIGREDVIERDQDTPKGDSDIVKHPTGEEEGQTTTDVNKANQPVSLAELIKYCRDHGLQVSPDRQRGPGANKTRPSSLVSQTLSDRKSFRAESQQSSKTRESHLDLRGSSRFNRSELDSKSEVSFNSVWTGRSSRRHWPDTGRRAPDDISSVREKSSGSRSLTVAKEIQEVQQPQRKWAVPNADEEVSSEDWLQRQIHKRSRRRRKNAVAIADMIQEQKKRLEEMENPSALDTIADDGVVVTVNGEKIQDSTRSESRRHSIATDNRRSDPDPLVAVSQERLQKAEDKQVQATVTMATVHRGQGGSEGAETAKRDRKRTGNSGKGKEVRISDGNTTLVLYGVKPVPINDDDKKDKRVGQGTQLIEDEAGAPGGADSKRGKVILQESGPGSQEDAAEISYIKNTNVVHGESRSDEILMSAKLETDKQSNGHKSSREGSAGKASVNTTEQRNGTKTSRDSADTFHGGHVNRQATIPATTSGEDTDDGSRAVKTQIETPDLNHRHPSSDTVVDDNEGIQNDPQDKGIRNDKQTATGEHQGSVGSGALGRDNSVEKHIDPTQKQRGSVSTLDGQDSDRPNESSKQSEQPELSGKYQDSVQGVADILSRYQELREPVCDQETDAIPEADPDTSVVPRSPSGQRTPESSPQSPTVEELEAVPALENGVQMESPIPSTSKDEPFNRSPQMSRRSVSPTRDDPDRTSSPATSTSQTGSYHTAEGSPIASTSTSVPGTQRQRSPVPSVSTEASAVSSRSKSKGRALQSDVRLYFLLEELKESYMEEESMQLGYIRELSHMRQKLKGDYIQMKVEEEEEKQRRREQEREKRQREEEEEEEKRQQEEEELKRKMEEEEKRRAIQEKKLAVVTIERPPVLEEQELETPGSPVEEPKKGKKRPSPRIDNKWDPEHPMYEQITKGFKSKVKILNTRRVQAGLKGLRNTGIPEDVPSSSVYVQDARERYRQNERRGKPHTSPKNTTKSKEHRQHGEKEPIINDQQTRAEEEPRPEQEPTTANLSHGNRGKGTVRKAGRGLIHNTNDRSRIEKDQAKEDTPKTKIPVRHPVPKRGVERVEKSDAEFVKELVDSHVSLPDIQQQGHGSKGKSSHRGLQHNTQATRSLPGIDFQFSSGDSKPVKSSRKRGQACDTDRSSKSTPTSAEETVVPVQLPEEASSSGASSGNLTDRNASYSKSLMDQKPPRRKHGDGVPMEQAVDIVKSRHRFYDEDLEQRISTREHRVLKIFKELQSLRKQRRSERDKFLTGSRIGFLDDTRHGNDRTMDDACADFLLMNYELPGDYTGQRSNEDLRQFLYGVVKYEMCSKGKSLYQTSKREKALDVLRQRAQVKQTSVAKLH